MSDKELSELSFQLGVMKGEILNLQSEVASLRAHQYVRPITFGPTHRSNCLHENSPSGRVTGIACPCPNCTIQSGVES